MPKNEAIYRWRQAGYGESRGRFYVSSWRYGSAEKGEPSTIMRTEWYETKAEQQARLDGFTSDEPA